MTKLFLTEKEIKLIDSDFPIRIETEIYGNRKRVYELKKNSNGCIFVTILNIKPNGVEANREKR